jgi:hypothetical protein
MQKLFLSLASLAAALLISCSGAQRPLTAAEAAHATINTATHALALFDDPRHAVAVFAPVVRAEEASLQALHAAEDMIVTAERLNITPDRCRFAELAHAAARAMQDLLAIAQTIDALQIPPEVIAGIQTLEAVAAAQTCINAGAH